MNNANSYGRSIQLTIVAAVLLIAVFGTGCSRGTPEEEARSILQKSGIHGGFVVHINCGDGAMTEALRLNDSFMVHGLDSSVDNIQKSRQNILSREKYGPVSVDRLSGDQLPYTDNMVNMIVAEGSMMAFSTEDGEKLWEASQPFSGHYSPEDIFVIDGLVWTGNIGLTDEVKPEESGEIMAKTTPGGRMIAVDDNTVFEFWKSWPSRRSCLGAAKAL
jgi:hypothetical protein